MALKRYDYCLCTQGRVVLSGRVTEVISELKRTAEEIRKGENIVENCVCSLQTRNAAK